MPIFKITRNKVAQVSRKENGFPSEAALRDFFAENLEEILGVRFLGKEYQTTGGRIDTIGIDENNSPVIIEYKWKENEEVLSQGLFYLNWLMKNKKHFDLLVNNKFDRKIQVNWDQPRVILLAQGFNNYILEAVQQVKYVELKTYSYYDSDILYLENVYSPSGIRAIKKATKKNVSKQKESLEYNLDYHLNQTSSELRPLAHELREKILTLPAIIERLDQKSGITYKTTKSFVRLEFKPGYIQVLIRSPHYYDDPKKLVKDITSHEWGYKGLVKFTPQIAVNDVFNLVRQSYESTL